MALASVFLLSENSSELGKDGAYFFKTKTKTFYYVKIEYERPHHPDLTIHFFSNLFNLCVH